MCSYSLLRAVFRDRCVLQRRCRAWRLVSDESDLRSLRDERESRFFGESLRVSTIREGVFDEKKRKEKKRKEREHERLFFTFPTIPHAKRAPAFPVVLEVFPFDGEENVGKRRSVSLSLFSLARARSRRNALDVASRLTLRADFAGITPAEIILQLVNDERATDDGVGAAQRNLHVLDGEVAPARGGLDVAEIPGVTNLIRRCAVIHVIRVKVRSRGHAPVGRVAEFVHVQTVLPRGETRDGTDDFRRTVAVLRQFEHAGDARRAREHAHRRLRVKQKNITDDDARVRQSLKNAFSSVRRRFASRRFLFSVPGRTLSSATTRTAIARDDLRRQNATRTRASSITRSMTHTTTLSRARVPSFDAFMFQQPSSDRDESTTIASSSPPLVVLTHLAAHGRDAVGLARAIEDENVSACMTNERMNARAGMRVTKC